MNAASTEPVEELSGWRHPRRSPSLPESHRSIHVPQGRRLLAQAARLRRAGLPGRRRLHGPGQLGHRPRRRIAQFGYTLLSVILLSNLMAVLLQGLALKLGIVTGRDLAQACRDHYSRPVASRCGCSARSPSPPATWPK